MNNPRFEKALRFLLYGGMIVVSLLYQLRPFNDPDFFWHLKTGEWIWQHRELPAGDPFNFVSPAVEPVGRRFTLTAYWLSQVSYHLIHDRLGMPGIVVLKLVVALLFVLALLKLRRGDPVVHAALVLVVLPLLFCLYPLDRPQAFSFLFFAVLLARLEKERTAAAAPSGWASGLVVPILMFAWANMHGGHAIGQVTIALYLALEGVKYLHPALRPAGRERYRRLLVLGVAGLGASFVNPNSWHALQIALVPAPAWVGNTDYLSTVRYFHNMDQPLIFIFWGALFLTALACLFTVTRPDITRIALLAGTGYYGFIHVRYVPYFMIAAVPVLGVFLSAERVSRWARQALLAGAVLLVTYVIWNEFPSRERVGAALGVNNAYYPVRAADFVIANDLRGNLYNTYVWGGYLLWRLAPERKVFVDGRGVNAQATFLSGSIALALAQSVESPMYWKNILKQYGIGYLIIPREQTCQGFVFDDTSGLREALREAPEWVSVFADETALVFVLNTPEHRAVIARYGTPTERLLGGG